MVRSTGYVAAGALAAIAVVSHRGREHEHERRAVDGGGENGGSSEHERARGRTQGGAAGEGYRISLRLKSRFPNRRRQNSSTTCPSPALLPLLFPALDVS